MKHKKINKDKGKQNNFPLSLTHPSGFGKSNPSQKMAIPITLDYLGLKFPIMCIHMHAGRPTNT